MAGPAPPPNGTPDTCRSCGLPAKGSCVFCGERFCYLHGGPGMQLCRRHWYVTTALAFAATLALIAGTILAAATHSMR